MEARLFGTRISDFRILTDYISRFVDKSWWHLPQCLFPTWKTNNPWLNKIIPQSVRQDSFLYFLTIIFTFLFEILWWFSCILHNVVGQKLHLFSHWQERFLRPNSSSVEWQVKGVVNRTRQQYKWKQLTLTGYILYLYAYPICKV